MMSRSLKNKTGIYAITSMLYMQVVVSVLLGGIAFVFPDASLYQIQLVFSITSITGVVGSLLAGKLADYISKKTLTLASLVLLVLSGVAPLAFHSNINQFILFSGIVGLTVGMLQTLSNSYALQLFQGEERDRVIGVNQSVMAVAGTVFIYIAGVFAASNYLNGFYVYLIAIVVIVIVCICLPAGRPEKQERAASHEEKVNALTGGMVKLLVMMLLFASLQGAFMQNISLLVENSGIGDASVSGLATSLYIAGGILVGFTLGPVMKWTKQFVLPFCFLLSGIALLLPVISLSVPACYLCGALCGFSCTLFYGVCLAETPNVVAPNAMTMAAGLISAVFGLGSFISPYIVNPISTLLTAASDKDRMMVAGISTLICGVLAVLLYARPKKAEH